MLKSGENGLVGPGSNNYGKTEPKRIKVIQIPTCGRMVHYFPVLPDAIKAQNPDYCKVFPAIVVEASDLCANITIFSLGSNPAEGKFSVPHKSIALDASGEPSMSYWDWPVLK